MLEEKIPYQIITSRKVGLKCLILYKKISNSQGGRRVYFTLS